jgi:DNA polymerase III epsilon subunit-like protein
MKLLSIDTETTAFSPSSGQVIEIAGVIVDIDLITLEVQVESKFEETIALRGHLDERITRVTGITEQELSSADPIHKVQERWYEFCKHLPATTPLVGHSLSFDVAFLQAESWFLPSEFKSIDTLLLAKILYPDQSAVNLEHLLEAFQLQPHAKQLSQLGISDTSLLKPHRAINLLAMEVKNISQTPIPTTALNAILSHYLPIGLQLYAKPLPALTFSESGEKETVPLTFEGEIIEPSLFHLLNLPYTDEQIASLEATLVSPLPEDIRLICIQLVLVMVTKRLRPTLSLKLHGRGNADYLLGEYLLLSYHKTADRQENQEYCIKQFESIITSVKHLSEYHFSLTNLIHVIEWYAAALKTHDSENPILVDLQKIISWHDFFIISLQPHLQRSEWYYHPKRVKPEEQIVVQKIKEWFVHLEILRGVHWNTSTNLLTTLSQAIRHFVIKYRDNQDINILSLTAPLLARFQGNAITFSAFKPQFNLTSTISNVLKTNPNLTIETYLNEEEFDSCLKLTGLFTVFEEHNPIVIHKNSPDPSMELSDFTGSLSEYLELLKDELARENKAILLLCGQNSSLKDMDKSLPDKFNNGEYFVLGESGSLTKIVSKIMKSKRGVVAVKNGDFYYISRYLKHFECSSIWMVNMPYFPIHRYWQTLAEHSNDKESYLNSLKWMYLKGQTAFIQAKSGKQVKFLKGYR